MALINIVGVIQQGFLGFAVHSYRKRSQGNNEVFNHCIHNLRFCQHLVIQLLKQGIQGIFQSFIGNHQTQGQEGYLFIHRDAPFRGIVINFLPAVSSGQQQGQGYINQLIQCHVVNGKAVPQQAVDQRLNGCLGTAVLQDLLIIGAQEAIDRGGQHCVAETMLSAVSGDILNGLLLTGYRIGKGDRSYIGVGLYIHGLRNGSIGNGPVQGDRAGR